MLHGLNNDARVMASLAQVLAQDEITHSFGKITGHFEETARLKHFAEATAEKWLEDAERAYREASAQSEDLILVGYSLGALLGVLLQQQNRAHFQRMILVAPALYVRTWCRLAKYLLPFGGILPSWAPPEVRANPGTPARAYGALFDLVAQFDAQKIAPPSLVVMSPGDELVSFRRVRSWCERQPEAEFVETKSNTRYQHLIADEPSLGPENWNAVAAEIRKFIAGPTKPPPHQKSLHPKRGP